MLRLINIGYSYPGGAGVEGVTLELNNGSFALLVGRTGAGKSTLIKLISLELYPDTGEIVFERLRTGILSKTDKSNWRRKLGIVDQDSSLLDDRSVLSNIILAAVCEPNLKGAKARSLRSLSRVGLAHKLHSYPSQLSSGERQRATIARALVNEPLLLLADEPVSNLDPETSKNIVEILQRINSMGMTILVATHQPERFEVCRPVVYRMESGRIARE